METSEVEVIIITTEQILDLLHKASLGALIQQIRNPGNIEDKCLRRLWAGAKNAIDKVERHLKEVVAEQNAQSR